MLLAALALATALPVSQTAATQKDAATSEARRIGTAEMVGDFYAPPTGAPAPAILLLGGSEGGLSAAAARQARLLAARGYAVLHLSYFGEEGQPKALRAIPVETFTRALDWLKAQPGVARDRIGVVGTSKGAEAALLVASRRPELKVAILGVPSSVVWPGIDREGVVAESSWTENGRPVAHTPYGWTGEWKGIHALYADGLADAGRAAAGAIPAERSGAAMVLVCGEQDALWPSCPMARAVEARLKTAHYRHGVTVLAYPGAGHAAFGAPVDANAPGASTIGALGGTVAGNIAARADGWPRILAALDAALRPGAAR